MSDFLLYVCFPARSESFVSAGQFLQQEISENKKIQLCLGSCLSKYCVLYNSIFSPKNIRIQIYIQSQLLEIINQNTHHNIEDRIQICSHTLNALHCELTRRLLRNKQTTLHGQDSKYRFKTLICTCKIESAVPVMQICRCYLFKSRFR